MVMTWLLVIAAASLNLGAVCFVIYVNTQSYGSPGDALLAQSLTHLASEALVAGLLALAGLVVVWIARDIQSGERIGSCVSLRGMLPASRARLRGVRRRYLDRVNVQCRGNIDTLVDYGSDSIWLHHPASRDSTGGRVIGQRSLVGVTALALILVGAAESTSAGATASVGGRTHTTSSACKVDGTSSFSPPLGLKNEKTTVTTTGTIGSCPKNPYGVTGGSFTTTGKGEATCNPKVSDALTSTGSIVWDDSKGTNSYTSTSTTVAKSSPPASTVKGYITGGGPVPIGTPTDGQTTATVTKATKAACNAGKLQSLTFAGTTSSPSPATCTLKGELTFRPPLSLKNRKTKVTFKGTISSCSKNPYGIKGASVENSGTGLATCDPSVSDTLTSKGTIAWTGGLGKNSYTSTSTSEANSNPPTDKVKGHITGGKPLPKGTPTGGGTVSFKPTSASAKECIAGTLRHLDLETKTTG